MSGISGLHGVAYTWNFRGFCSLPNQTHVNRFFKFKHKFMCIIPCGLCLTKPKHSYSLYTIYLAISLSYKRAQSPLGS